MLAKWLRRWIGGVRLAMTLLTVLAGLAVVFLAGAGLLTLSAAAWAFLGSLVGNMAVFVVKDSQRPASSQIPGYYGPEVPGNVTEQGERIGGAD